VNEEPQKTPEEPKYGILKFEPFAPLYPVDAEGDVIPEQIIRKEALVSRMRVAITNPWAEDDEVRFLPGLVFGSDNELVFDVGESYGQLVHQEDGWFCTCLLPKGPVLEGVVETLLEKATGGSFTQRLLRRSKK